MENIEGAFVLGPAADASVRGVGDSECYQARSRPPRAGRGPPVFEEKPGFAAVFGAQSSESNRGVRLFAH